MATVLRTLPQQRDYWAVGITHLFVDILNSSRNLIIALLAISLGISNTGVGVALMVYNIGNALMQPVFGWLADRVGPRWLVVGGIAWMISLGSLTALSGGWPALIAITAMGIGSGAFHPSGTMVATQSPTTNRNQSTAVFFLFGQMGIFFGPLLAGWLLDNFGFPGYIALPVMAVIALVSSWQWVTNDRHPSGPSIPTVDRAQTAQPRKAWTRRRITRAAALGLTTFGYSTVGVTFLTYMPKLFAELDYELDYIGLLSGLFMLGSAVGGYAGGWLADRYRPRRVIIGALFLASVPIYFALPAVGALQAVLLIGSGFFSGMPHSLLVLKVQSMLPGRQAFASGLVLGFMFFSGSIGSTVIGVIADQIGLMTALQGLAVLPFLAAGTAFFLPRESR